MAAEAALGRAVLELATDDKNLTAGLAEAKAQAGGLGPALAGAGAQASTFGERLGMLGKQAGVAGMASKVLSSALGSFTVAGLATNAITGLVGALQTFASNGAKLPAIAASFDRLTSAVKINAGVMLGEMRRGTQSLVSDLDLMQSANKALLLGLPVTAQSMGELANTARVLGKAMGQDATKSLDDLITALGRSSPMILDNLGLTVKVGEANEVYARKLNKSADALTDAEKKMAFYEAAMEAARIKTEQLGEQTMTLGEIMTSAWVRIGNVITETAAAINVGIGSALSSGQGFLAFAEDVIIGNAGMAISNANLREQLKALAAARKASMGKDVNLESYESTLKKVRDAAASTTAAIVPLNAEQRALAAQFEKSGKSAAQIAEELNKVQGWKVHTEAVNQALGANKKATAAATEHAEALGAIRAAAIPLTAAQQAQAEANDRLGISASTTAKALGISSEAVTQYLEGLENGKAIADTWIDLHAKMGDASKKFISKAVADWQAGQQAIADASGKAIADQLRQAGEFEQKNADVLRSGTALKLAQIERERDATIAALNAASSQRGPIYDRDLAAIKRFYQNQIDVANGTASTIEQRMRAQGVLTRAELTANAAAATRDYNQMREAGIYTAEEIQAAFERMTGAIEKSRGAAVNWGGVLQQVAGILGNVGGKAGGVIGIVGSIGQSMDVAAASTTKWGNSAGLAAPLFSAGATSAQKAAAGVASGAAVVSGALDVWAATSEKTGKAAGALNGAVAGAKAGAAFGPYGVAIGAVAGALVGLIRNLNAGRNAIVDFAKTFDTAAAGTGFDELHAKLLKVAGGEELWIQATQKIAKGDINGAKKAIEAINAALADQDNWLQRLPGVLDKYGIAWTEAGVAVNQARLDEVAKGLIQDFADLSRAGVSVDVITTKMSDSVNAYIQDAIKTGTEIPPAMRPLLEKMIELGTLTDADGKKIESLEGSGITFAQTMTEGFQSVVGAIKELTKALGGVGDAVEKIPSKKRIDVEYRGSKTGEWPSSDDGAGDDGIPTVPMARGGFGRVLRPTLFYSRGAEDFAFSGEGRSFGLGALAKRPTEITVVSELDGRVVARNQIRHTPNELARAGVRSR